MSIRLSKLDVAGEELARWRYCGGDQVPETYQKLFPKSRLPLLRDLVFWLVVTVAAVWKSK